MLSSSLFWNPVTRYLCEKLNTISSYIPPPPNYDFVKRKVLIIHAHPVEESYSNALCDVVYSTLIESGHEVKKRYLYNYNYKDVKHSFNPSLQRNEWLSYLNPDDIEKRKTSEGLKKLNIPNDIKLAIEELRWCDSIVFIFPTWWYNFPAILKGYFDRVFLPGVAFEFAKTSEDNINVIPGLENIKKIGVVTTYGGTMASVLYCGDNSRNFMSNGLRTVFDQNCLLMWNSLYNTNNATPQERVSFLKEVKAAYKTF